MVKDLFPNIQANELFKLEIMMLKLYNMLTMGCKYRLYCIYTQILS